MANSPIDLSQVFLAVQGALAQNQTNLNQADTYNHDHGNNMVHTFDVITQLLWPRWQAGDRAVAREHVLMFLDGAAANEPQVLQWSDSTRRKLAGSIFFGLMVSLVGRLGGLNHVSRAFILALIAVALLIPWQVLGLSVFGVTWTPNELLQWLPARSANLGNTIIFYLRFTGYWLLIVLLLILAQIRASRWSKTILRRLEVI